MRKFAVRALLFFILMVCSVLILNFLYVNTSYWKRTEQTLKFKDVPSNIQIANVGSSHGWYAFDYSDNKEQYFNFALDSQYFIYDLAVLKQYIHHFEKNAVLLIPISYFQITTIKKDFTDQRGRYYRFLEKELIENYSIYDKLMFKYFPVLSAGDTLQFIVRDAPALDRYKFMTGSELIEYSEMKHKSWTTDSETVYEAGEDGFQHNKQMVSQIIDFSYANDIQPVLITTPITSILNNIYDEKSPHFFETFYRFSRELQEDYPSLRYFDYSHDPRFENEFSLFQDADHLNAIGAKKFTETVIHDLQSMGIIVPSN